MNKIINWIRIAFHSLFFGMEGGEKILKAQSSGTKNTEINEVDLGTSVFADMLKEQETQQVKEVRDESYRTLRESENYLVDLKLTYDGDIKDTDTELTATARKKTISDFLKHCNVYDNNLPIKVIQDNNIIRKDNNFVVSVTEDDARKTENYDYLTTLIVTRKEGYTPTFCIEKLVKKVVVKEFSATQSIVELYYPMDPPQFGTIARMALNKFKKAFTENRLTEQLFQLDTIKFYTDKPWTSKGCHSNELFEYKNAKVHKLATFDGSYVIEYLCDIVTEFEYVGKKYETKEIDTKLKNNAPRKKATDVFTIERNLNKNY